MRSNGISDNTAKALKATTLAAYDAVGGTDQASDVTGISVSQLSKYASTGKDWKDRFIRIDIAVDLDRRSPNPFILTTMAREVGFRLERTDSAAADFTLSAMGVLKLDKILDDVVHETAEALADGNVCHAEKQAIRKKVALAKIALARLDAMMLGGE